MRQQFHQTKLLFSLILRSASARVSKDEALAQMPPNSDAMALTYGACVTPRRHVLTVSQIAETRK